MTSESSDSRFFCRWWALLGWIAVIAAIWVIVLPRLGEMRDLRRRIEREQKQGINPDAMFYTELEMMESVLDRIEVNSHVRRH